MRHQTSVFWNICEQVCAPKFEPTWVKKAFCTGGRVDPLPILGQEENWIG